MDTKHCVHCGKSHSSEIRCPHCGWTNVSFDLAKMEQMARATGWTPPTISNVQDPHRSCAKCGAKWEIVAGPKGYLPQGYVSCPRCNHEDSPYRVCGTCGRTWIAAMMYADPKIEECPHCSNQNAKTGTAEPETTPLGYDPRQGLAKAKRILDLTRNAPSGDELLNTMREIAEEFEAIARMGHTDVQQVATMIRTEALAKKDLAAARRLCALNLKFLPQLITQLETALSNAPPSTVVGPEATMPSKKKWWQFWK